MNARNIPSELPGDAHTYISDRGYDADWLGEALQACVITPCISPHRNRVARDGLSAKLYKSRRLVERMFGRLKDWRRISMCYDRYAHTFISAICVAATFIFWFPVLSLEARPASSDLRSHCRFSAERKNQKSYNLINQSPG